MGLLIQKGSALQQFVFALPNDALFKGLTLPLNKALRFRQDVWLASREAD